MVVLMRYQTDCEVAALATALNITWEEAQKALDWRRLPKGLENPVFGSPINLYRALIDLGYWKANKTLTQLLKGDYTPGKCIVLIHNPSNPTLQQHWLVLGAKRPDHGGYEVFWGDSETPRFITEKMLKEYFLAGWPNCAMEPYKAHITRIWWEKIKAFWLTKNGLRFSDYLSIPIIGRLRKCSRSFLVKYKKRAIIFGMKANKERLLI